MAYPRLEQPRTNDLLANSLMNHCFIALRTESTFPRRTGHLQSEALDVQRTEYGFKLFIHNDGSTKSAPYQFFLEYGTKPHVINVGNRFIHHPGSKKHVGFWSKRSFSLVVNTIITLTNGKIVNE